MFPTMTPEKRHCSCLRGKDGGTNRAGRAAAWRASGDNGKRLLAVELEPGAGQAELASLKEAVAWARLDTIKVFAQIAVDKRHNAKINYPELRKLLNRNS